MPNKSVPCAQCGKPLDISPTFDAALKAFGIEYDIKIEDAYCSRDCFLMDGSHKTGVDCDDTSASHGPRLTPRQLEVLQLVMRGLANKQIADKLNMAVATVKMFIRQLMHVFAVTNRTQLALRGHGLPIG